MARPLLLGSALLLAPAAGSAAALGPEEAYVVAGPSLRTIRVPILIGAELIERVLLERIFAESAPRALVDPSGCSSLELSEPRLETAAARLELRLDVVARAGAPRGAECVSLALWRGKVELEIAPTILAAGQGIGFVVRDSRALDAAGGEALVAGAAWALLEGLVRPRIEGLRIDLAAMLAEARATVLAFLPGEAGARLGTMLDSVRLIEVAAGPDGLAGAFAFQVPEAGSSPGANRGAEAPLTPAEIEHVRSGLAALDAFVTFLVRQSAGEPGVEGDAGILLAALLDLRHRIVEVLVSPVEPGPDPVRALFVASLAELSPVLERIASRLPGEAGLGYLALVTAVRAVAALDRQGPGTGLDISSDGLRRLARLVAPRFAGDPLRIDPAVDPELRRRLGFGAPLPRSRPAPAGGAWRIPWPWRDAVASPDLGPDPELLRRLDRWVPGPGELEQYLPAVRDLLDATVRAVTAAGAVPAEDRRLLRTMVLATGWQESCWRQFVREAGAVRVLRSPAGSVGIMQVNVQVWRGFYDPQGLVDDAGYNARAGTEILAHYYRDYALELVELRAGDARVRATYSMYHGGPRHALRVQRPETSPPLRAIDDSFYRKYLAVATGDDLAVIACYPGG